MEVAVLSRLCGKMTNFSSSAENCSKSDILELALEVAVLCYSKNFWSWPCKNQGQLPFYQGQWPFYQGQSSREMAVLSRPMAVLCFMSPCKEAHLSKENLRYLLGSGTLGHSPRPGRPRAQPRSAVATEAAEPRKAPQATSWSWPWKRQVCAGVYVKITSILELALEVAVLCYKIHTLELQKQHFGAGLGSGRSFLEFI